MPCPLVYDDQTFFAWSGTVGVAVNVSLIANATTIVSASYNGIILSLAAGSVSFKIVKDYAELRLYFAGPSNPGGDSMTVVQDCGNGTQGTLHDDDNSLAYSITFLIHGSEGATH